MSELALNSSLAMVGRQANFAEQVVHQALEFTMSQVVRSTIFAELKKTWAAGGARIATQNNRHPTPAWLHRGGACETVAGPPEQLLALRPDVFLTFELITKQVIQGFLGVAGLVFISGVVLPNEASTDPVTDAVMDDVNVFRVTEAQVLQLLLAVLAALLEPMRDIGVLVRAVLHHADVEENRKFSEALGRLCPEPRPQVLIEIVKDARKMTTYARWQVRQGDMEDVADES